MADANEVERLKSVIIEHVAKDVLILTDTVDKLAEQLNQVGNMLKLLEENTANQFDVSAKKIIDLLTEQEKHLAELADSRTKQISLTVSDNVEKILNAKFEGYQTTVDKALDKFNSANVAAVESLNRSYQATESKIKSGIIAKPSGGISALGIISLMCSASTLIAIGYVIVAKL